jgi:SSS family solute:Na+ symporter
VVAGLLAAAMSSLSSGINSSAAVISVDYVGRARKEKGGPGLVETQIVSWCIGVVAVLLSMLAGYVQGGLLDVVYKIGNLLVAPLFVLFFMALFIKRATWPATFAAVVCSIAAAVAVAFGDQLAVGIRSRMPYSLEAVANAFDAIAGVGVLWIMPLSLAVGIIIGVSGSLIGLGRRAPELVFAEAPTVAGE